MAKPRVDKIVIGNTVFHDHGIEDLPESLINTGDAAGGDLSGTYPNPSVVDDSHNHTYATITPAFVGTKAAILALSAATYAGKFAIATTESSTDTTPIRRLYYSDGTDWLESPMKFYVRTGVNMGAVVTSSKTGYEDDFITNKRFYNVSLKGYTATPENGSIRYNVDEDPDTLELYAREGTEDEGWFTILYDFTTGDGDLQHSPLGYQIRVASGNSVAIAPNGYPFIHNYLYSMGTDSRPRTVGGGTF